MVYTRYADIDCDCPKCWNAPSFEFPSCFIHVRWSNQFGAKFTIFCENCGYSVDMSNVSGEIKQSDFRLIERPLYNWKTRDWKIARREYLLGVVEKFKISYRGNPSVLLPYHWEIAIIEEHLKR